MTDHVDPLRALATEEDYDGNIPTVKGSNGKFPNSVGVAVQSLAGTICRGAIGTAVLASAIGLPDDGVEDPVFCGRPQHTPKADQGALIRLIHLAMDAWLLAGSPWV